MGTHSQNVFPATTKRVLFQEVFPKEHANTGKNIHPHKPAAATFKRKPSTIKLFLVNALPGEGTDFTVKGSPPLSDAFLLDKRSPCIQTVKMTIITARIFFPPRAALLETVGYEMYYLMFHVCSHLSNQKRGTGCP